MGNPTPRRISWAATLATAIFEWDHWHPTAIFQWDWCAPGTDGAHGRYVPWAWSCHGLEVGSFSRLHRMGHRHGMMVPEWHGMGCYAESHCVWLGERHLAHCWFDNWVHWRWFFAGLSVFVSSEARWPDMSCSLLYVITWPIMAGKMRPQGQSYFKLKTIHFYPLKLGSSILPTIIFPDSQLVFVHSLLTFGELPWVFTSRRHATP